MKIFISVVSRVIQEFLVGIQALRTENHYSGKIMQSQFGDSQEFQSLEAASQQLHRENLAQCRIWAHWLFWTICPFGPIISAFKCKMWKPLLIAISISFCAGAVSAFAETDEDAEIISGLGIFASVVIGGAMTQNAISDSRK